jgi:XTP/dITP diphosphohydrolase
VELILATRNAHKVLEVSRLLAPYGLTVAPLPQSVVLPPEDGDSYEANALPKARAAALALGVAVIADDSGIESAALGGRPGVRSARFAGEHASDAENLGKLLADAPAGSELRYICAVAFVEGDSEQVFFGDCRGRLAAAPAGSGGFGYDPAFLPADRRDGLTMAQLSEVEKDAISHRGHAVRAFADWFTSERSGAQRPKSA